MPIFKVKNELVHFAHVPKCAGSSVETYLEKRFGKLAFYDRRHFTEPEKWRWTRSSPQHVPVSAIDRLFPEGFLMHSFGIVRHPADRVASAFLYNRDVIGRLFRKMPFDVWLWRLENNLKINHAFFDFHFLPQVEFVPDDAKVFRLEEGLDPVVEYLDQIAGVAAPNLKIGHENQGSPGPALTAAQTKRIERIYTADYEAFGYERQFPLG